MCQRPGIGFEERLNDLLKVLKVLCDSDEIKNFVTSSDDNGSNCLLLAVQFSLSPKFLKEFFSFVRSVLNIHDQRNLFQKCDNDRKNIFMFASLKNKPEILSLVQQSAEEILSKNQIKEMLMQMRQ